MDLFEKIEHTVAQIRTFTDHRPQIGFVLGTGLGDLEAAIEVSCTIPYEDISFFPQATVESHKGELIFGDLFGVPVVAMSGRFHYYEGHSMESLTFPIRVLKKLGITVLILSNAAGGTNADFHAGDMVFVRDHINLHYDNPLRGPNDERLGPRFPDMLRTYNRQWNARALQIAKGHGFRAHEGVYFGWPGPNLETPAEYEFIHRVGGDLVGMSTIPEVLVARHMGLPVFVVSVVTNVCYPLEAIRETTVAEVIEVAQGAAPKVGLVLTDMIREGVFNL
ncbi:MAG: purine-nucleoside phosphorylase [Saprospiraceae bacterium]|nr:purine-nucleoside phosphorylase [Saprospiraceae bacterium]